MTTPTIIRISAIAIVLDVIAVYAYCLGTKGIYPPSHPWAAVALLTLSVGAVVRGRNREAAPPVFAWLYPVAVLLSATLWTVAAMLQR